MKNTHIGELIGMDARTPDGYRKTVQLRQTANFWIANTIKYRKKSGYMVGEKWPLYKLDLNSIKEIVK